MTVQDLGAMQSENDSLRIELIAALSQNARLAELCQDIAMALDGPETPLEGHDMAELVEVVARIKADAQRFAIVRHAARTMTEDGGEPAFLDALEQYKVEHGL